MTQPDLHDALTAATEACGKAAPVIMEGYADANLEVGSKTDAADVYTPVDKRAQAIIRDVLEKRFPDIPFVGEEDDSPASSAAWCWVVDPLDGTSNYSHKIPHFGTSIALLKEGKTVAAVLHFPVTGDTYAAAEGKGATKNGVQIRIQDRETLESSVLAEMFSDRTHRGKTVTYPPGIAYRRFGSAITPLAFLAEGRVHGTLLRCRLWDVAAADLVIREAGGRTRLQSDTPGDMRGLVLFAAAVPGIYDAFIRLADDEYAPSLLR